MFMNFNKVKDKQEFIANPIRWKVFLGKSANHVWRISKHLDAVSENAETSANFDIIFLFSSSWCCLLFVSCCCKYLAWSQRSSKYLYSNYSQERGAQDETTMMMLITSVTSHNSSSFDKLIFLPFDYDVNP